jgi:integrase
MCLALVAPTEVNRTVTPTRRPNAELRTREHLTLGEVEALMEAAKANRHGQRDATMILLAFRHGLRAAEACDLRWDQVDFNAAVLHVRRVKNGGPSTHPLLGDELRALRRLQRESAALPFVFVSERGSGRALPLVMNRFDVPRPDGSVRIRHGFVELALIRRSVVRGSALDVEAGHRTAEDESCHVTLIANSPPGGFDRSQNV